ncbi:MAG: rhodanese-like domain-containing protein [Armatimonadetes bacterium]|nr:rhodanese-like domain-containing protein [Armatimonadota bacterium]
MNTVRPVAAPELHRRLTSPEPPLVLDVRTPAEWESGHIEHSLNFPLDGLGEREIPAHQELVVYCQRGSRSAVAAGILAARGIACSDLVGGIAAWQAAGYPITDPAPAVR